MGSSTVIMAESRFRDRRTYRSWSGSEALDRVRSGAGPGGSSAQAVWVRSAVSRPSSATEVSRILNFWTLPVTVMGNSSTNRQ
jgi:hypothetical protein